MQDLCDPASITNTGTALVGQIDIARWGYDIRAYAWKMWTSADGQFNTPQVVTFPLTNIDDAMEEILAFNSTVSPYKLNNSIPYINHKTASTMTASQQGLALKTYQSDIFNNWLNTTWISGVSGISAVTAISTATGSFTIDTLNLSKKVYDMLNRIAISGGSYDDWIDAVYAHEKYRRAESPIYLGGLSKELVFQEVVSNAPSDVLS